jgi:hypothetical protein
VRLLLEHGYAVPDTEGRLEGSTKQTRHLTLRMSEDIDAGYIRSLLLEAIAYSESKGVHQAVRLARSGRGRSLPA